MKNCVSADFDSFLYQTKKYLERKSDLEMTPMIHGCSI